MLKYLFCELKVKVFALDFLPRKLKGSEGDRSSRKVAFPDFLSLASPLFSSFGVIGNHQKSSLLDLPLLSFKVFENCCVILGTCGEHSSVSPQDTKSSLQISWCPIIGLICVSEFIKS
ncbi:unnamed protein product [Moneuplotes crassus]|uniref:Uncharacterized protein n=1 Tax=Euplotes crassus TaxID=5936 RepID=A0AAD1Y675_EUPCR|nr:unnamed protein product [Moneuplotes crassus]